MNGSNNIFLYSFITIFPRLVNQLLSKAMIDIPLRGWGITALLLIAKKLLHFVKKYLVYI